MMAFYKNFIINPEVYRNPVYTISPFTTEYVARNYELINSDTTAEVKTNHFFGNDLQFVENGKVALGIVLDQYSLAENDEVYIVTTTGNKYVSSCITNEIEKKCKWSRLLSARTKLILVNHEFGIPYTDFNELLKLNIPIIEDRAMSMLSIAEDGKTGFNGDFTIYSMPKFFPVQAGGIIQTNATGKWKAKPKLDLNSEVYQRWFKFYIADIDSIKEKRKHNYRLFEKYINPLGFNSRFQLNDTITPSVYMFNVKNINLDELKKFIQRNGIEASVFYGEEAFFVPVHQNLSEIDIKFICTLIQYFCHETK